MKQYVLSGSGGEVALEKSRASSHHLIKPAVKKLLLVLLIIAEIEACANAATFIGNDSNARAAYKRATSVFCDISCTSLAPVISSVPVAANGVYQDSIRYKGPVLSKSKGTITGPSGKETYYNLNMSGVVKIMRRMGNTDEYWVREDGVKMLGDYVMVAANLNVHPRGSLVETSLGTAIVCDTGGFAKRNPYQLDIAVTW